MAVAVTISRALTELLRRPRAALADDQSLGGTESRIYEYDVESRLPAVLQGSQIKGIGYDGDGGLRVLKDAAGNPIRHYVTADYQVDLPSGEPYLYYRFGGRTVAWGISTTLRFLLGDHLSSVDAELNNQTAQGQLRYRPYGSQRVLSGSLTRDERFTEQKRIDDGGGVANRELYHYGARFYLCHFRF